MTPSSSNQALRRFRSAYAQHRASEGRATPDARALLELPYATTGPLVREWRIRARTFKAFEHELFEPVLAKKHGRPLTVLDLGAGNGWLSRRMQDAGASAVALDVRTDEVDGLGAARNIDGDMHPSFPRIAATFDDLPLRSQSFDIVLFNASLHYAVDLAVTIREAARVLRPGGWLAILDSPFYESNADGTRMVEQKKQYADAVFGSLKDALTAIPFIEFLTADTLRAASAPLGLAWTRKRVRYPLGYELRPLVARLKRRRRPSRFDLWVARKPRRTQGRP